MSNIIKIARQFANDLGVELKHVQVAKVQDKFIFSSGDNLRIVTAISKEQVITQLKNKFKDTPEQIEQILQADPHPDKAYSVWIGKLLLSKNIILPEDASKIIENINLFNDLKKRNKIKGVDINRLNTYQELSKVVEEASGQKTKGEEFRENLSSGQELIFQDSEFKAVKISTVEATTELCRGMKDWCVKDPAYSKGYIAGGPFILIYKNNSPYVLIHEQSGSAKDIYDDAISDYEGYELAEIIEHLGITTFKDELSVILDNIDDNYLLENLDAFSYEAAKRGIILIDEYVSFVQKNTPDELTQNLYRLACDKKSRLPAKYEKYILGDLKYASFYIQDVVKGRWPEAEPVIAQDAQYSLVYARDVVEGRWPEGEATIAQDANTSYYYATSVIRGRFELGEAAIAKDYTYAYQYADRIFLGRWPMGEEAISKNHRAAYKYARFIINGPWPEGEAMIATNSETAYLYASSVLEGRFELGEEAIAADAKYSFNYAKRILKGRFYMGEEAIAQDAHSSFDYARNVIKGRFEPGEAAIATNWALSQYYGKEIFGGIFPPK